MYHCMSDVPVTGDRLGFVGTKISPVKVSLGQTINQGPSIDFCIHSQKSCSFEKSDPFSFAVVC